MSGSSRPNILKRKNIKFQENKKEKEAAISQNILAKSKYYQKLVNETCKKTTELNLVNETCKNTIELNANCKEEARVKRKRKNSPTSQKCNIDLDDVARVDREARLANQAHLDNESITTSHSKPLFSEVEFLDENVWNIGSDDDDVSEPPPIEETNYPRTVHDNFQWKIIKEINSEQTRRDHFTGKPGPVTEYITPYDAFTAIWNHDVLEAILKTTNKKGKANNQAIRENEEKNNKLQHREPPWRDITITEMYVFLAIVMSTAACKKFKFNAYFAQSGDINDTPLYGKYMSLKRFHRIHRALCFVDESSQEAELNHYEQKLLGINPLVKLLNESFCSLYNLHQNIVIEKIKSVNIKGNFCKFERVLGLFDSSTGYCWQLSYIIDEVPKCIPLLQRIKAENQYKNDHMPNNSLAETNSPVYVDSLKKRKITEKESNSFNNDRITKMPKPPNNKSKTLSKKSDLLTTAINKKLVMKDLKKHETDKPIESNQINLDQPEKNKATVASEKLQKEIPCDEDLPPLSRPVPATVLGFVKNLHFKGHTLFMDWSLQSLPLARTLKSLGIDCVGSFSGNTQYAPGDLKLFIKGKLKLIPGQVLGYTTDDIDIILWNERRVLTLLSTYHGLATIGATNLQAAVEYNLAMSVVDRFKKTMKELSFYIICKTELKHYVSYLLKISLINAYILYGSSSKAKNMNLKEFVEDVVEGLLKHHSSYKGRRRKVNSSLFVVNVSSNLRDHLPVPVKKPWPRCDFCVNDGYLVYNCVGCKKYLCVKCFTKYHETIAARMISE